ncbi:Uncharacterised protein [Metamycoplasma arthritidis]|uniref:Hypothetical membrane protein n=1 Tax=Metamycoplasma arthritidis (strain 158L3-1) TaxID=243272 RepID=B3PMQ2_META1|nr:hypothetical protein [Metamycoplasma arthritidis]ACF07304.1 hypothetical membrane protein [Metamycoplasma arthritidis 158L3-1]VEU78825.1 Uncharacterised protein [Metamycoplasma arthritidis]
MKAFKKMSLNQIKKYEGGFAITTLISTIFSGISLGVGALATLMGAIKSVQSPKGEIKTKSGNSVKWESSSSSNSNKSLGAIYYVI